MVRDNYDMLPGSGCNLREHILRPMPDDRVIRFLFIGRVMHLKGIEEYLEAAKRVKDRYADTEFLIAGWNEEEKYQQIVTAYQEQGYVKYIGFCKDIKQQIAKAHCVVLPSHGGEGVPNVLLESAAAGRPCIGSGISGTRDVIEDGVTGYLFEAGDAAGLADTMEKFLLLAPKQRAAMGRAGRAKVEKEFDREIVIEKYLNEVKNTPEKE